MLANVGNVYRDTFSRVLDDSPFVILHGRDPVFSQHVAFKLKHPVTDYEQLIKIKEKDRIVYKKYYARNHNCWQNSRERLRNHSD